jgi:SAM-dependent methyltransferase
MSSPTEQDIPEILARYSWYHCIDLTPDLRTPGYEIMLPMQCPVMAELRRCDLAGKRVLDIGCRDGLFSFEAEKMGASEVLGIDNDLSRGATEFLIPWFKSKVRMQAVNLYDFETPAAERFDFVLFAGVLYHLRFPFLGIKRIADAMRPGATLLLETAMWATRQPVAALYCPAPQDSPYDPTSVTFYNDPGLTAALSSMGFDKIECRHVLSDDGNAHANWREFLLSAYWTGADGSKVRIARAVYTATKTSIENDRLGTYWYGTHTLNSVHADNREFLGQFDQIPRWLR